jgi:hypothetical protein
MTPLEQRYRRLLRRLPAWYRRRWEEDMVTTYLAATVPADPDEAEYVEQCGRPSREERLSILRLAVRLRLGGIGDPPHARTWGDAVRRVALAGLLANALVEMSWLWRNLWFGGWLPGSPVSASTQELGGIAALGVGETLLEMAGLLWVVAFVALVVGRRSVATVTGGIALLPTGVYLVQAVVRAAATQLSPYLVTQVSTAMVTVAPLVALAAFHAQAPSVAPRRWLTGLGAAALLSAIPAYVSLTPQGYVLDRPGLLAGAIAVGAVVHLARSRAGRTELGWTLALTVMAGAVVALRAITLLNLVVIGTTDTGALVPVWVAQTAVVAVLGAVLWTRAARGLRDLPVTADQAQPPHALTS